jgi:hypothetical protein
MEHEEGGPENKQVIAQGHWENAHQYVLENEPNLYIPY